MPTDNKFLVNLRGTAAYARFLGRLEARVKESGVRIEPGPNALADYALVVLGFRYGLKAPPRVKSRGRPRKAEGGPGGVRDADGPPIPTSNLSPG